MVKFRIYIEGGGQADWENRDAALNENSEAFRRGWLSFFGKVGLTRDALEIVVGGGRNEAFALFCKSIARDVEAEHGEVKPLLLVDSEGLVDDNHSSWEHLKVQDNWDQPDSASAESAYLMGQAMETWLLADREALHLFFRQQFDASALEDSAPLESISTEVALRRLRQATMRCRPRYRKGKVSFDLLGQIDPTTVAAACPHAKDLLDYLLAQNP